MDFPEWESRKDLLGKLGVGGWRDGGIGTRGSRLGGLGTGCRLEAKFRGAVIMPFRG